MAAFGGGLGAAALVWLLALRRGEVAPYRLVLVGIAVGLGLGAATLLVAVGVDPDVYRAAARFQSGSLAGRGWSSVAAILPWFARMAQDGVWVVSDEEPARPRGRAGYNAKLIGDLEALIIEGERGWRELYAELGVIPYEVVYEDLVSEEGVEQTVRGVLGHLGLPSAGPLSRDHVRNANPTR